VPSLFAPFSQADSSTAREFGGTGLGLSICKHLVTLMHGEVGLDSAAGQDSTFWVELDLEAGAPTPTQEPPTTGALRILVVDDNRINLVVATKMLERMGHVAKAVMSGPAALEALGVPLEAADGSTSDVPAPEEPFDVILMDCMMPKMDGYETTRRIRETGVRAPIIAVTASILAEEQSDCLACGMNDIIWKPLNRAHLARVLAKWAA
jgi:CheY-like chemotaxis protein